MLDVEASFTGQTKATISPWVDAWCVAVSNDASGVGLGGLRPAVYCSSSHSSTYFDSTVAAWITDIADWPYAHASAAASAQSAASPPAGITPWTSWQFWQYDDQNVAQAYTTGDGDIFNGTLTQLINTMVIAGGNKSAIVSSNVPTFLQKGQTFTASITFTNTGGTTWSNSGTTMYRLGAQTPQDNTTWGMNRVSLPTATVPPGGTATFTATFTAPSTAGVQSFNWQMVQENTAWFGPIFSNTIAIAQPGPGTNFGYYTINTGGFDSTSQDTNYAAYTACGGSNAWYSYGIPLTGSNCTTFDRDIRWIAPAPSAYPFTGRGYLSVSALVPDTHATATANFFAVDTNGADVAGVTGAVNECANACNWINFFTGNVNLGSLAGFRSNTKDDGAPGAGGCAATCGGFSAGYSQLNIQAAQWTYMDDWTCLGSYASTNVSDTSNRSFTEANLYLYPALDSTHGNAIGALIGLNGKNPGHISTGDCNVGNTLNFTGPANGFLPGNAAAYGNANNADSYGFAWLYCTAATSPKFLIGSDDGNRLWVNGVLKNDTNASRGLVLDQDATTVSLPQGWNRVLFKVHNNVAGFQGVVGLRSSANTNLNEPLVNYHDVGGYYSYGLGYEQDAWYPQIVVTNFDGVVGPANGRTIYTNNTTVTAGGTANGQGPVPYWRTMQYQWGSGLGSVDTSYSDVSGTPTSASWTHTSIGVTGHRRFYFFAVSQSGRTSFQTNGLTGGACFQDSGNCGRYYDVYVDNVVPQSPVFSTAAATATNQIGLAWNIPLDQGVNVAAGPDESAGGATNLDAQNWYRVGDVAVQVYRDGAIISAWSTNTATNDVNLVANSSHTYAFKARDNNSGARGAWNNTSSFVGSRIVWTLSVPPISTSVTPDNATPHVGSNVTWTAVGGFGSAHVQYYRYVWDTSPTHVWADTETQWSSGTLALAPTSAGGWYLHVKGYNGGNVGNGTYDYSVTATASVSATALASSQNPAGVTSNVTFTATLSAVSPDTGTPSGNVVFMANGAPFSTNTLVNGSASALTAALPTGTNAIAALYDGDNFFLGSSNGLSQIILPPPAASQTNAIAGVTVNHDGTITFTLVGTQYAQYCLIATTNISDVGWVCVPGSTNTVTDPSGVWTVTVTNNNNVQFFRSVALTPAQ